MASELKALGKLLLALVLLVASVAHGHAAQTIVPGDHAHEQFSQEHSTSSETHSSHPAKHCGPILVSTLSVCAARLVTSRTQWVGVTHDLRIHLMVVDPPPPRKDLAV